MRHRTAARAAAPTTASAAVLLLLLTAGTSLGQATPAGTAQTVVEFADRPVVIDEAGLSVLPPLGATWQRVRGAGPAGVQITADSQAWLINVQTPQTKNPALTVAGVADAIAEQLLGQKAKGAEAPSMLGAPSSLTIDGREAERRYVLMPQPDNAPDVVRGYTVLRLAPDRFATFELITTRPRFDEARGVYEVVVGASKAVNPDAAAAARTAALDAGEAFLTAHAASLMPAAVEAAADRWDRLYAPAPTGADIDAREISYRRTRARAGVRGEVTAPANRSRWTDAERQPGWIVQIDSRYLASNDSAETVDTTGVYFVSADRADEAWTVTLELSSGGVWTERGRRAGDDMHVRVLGPDGSEQSFSPTVDGSRTLAQAERFLLGDLLTAFGRDATLAYFCWSTNEGRVVLRTDELRSAAQDKAWVVRSTLAENAQPLISFYTRDGRLQRTELPRGAHEDAQVWTPVPAKRLASLWQSKGLPLD